jgi:hypothetical protein
MFCRKCHYDLRGLGRGTRCPECGTEYHPDDPTTFLSSWRPPPAGERMGRYVWIIAFVAIAAACIRILTIWARAAK